MFCCLLGLSSVRCNLDGQTIMGTNGEQQEARFSFEAFRFAQTEATFSTYYIHCATRLCVNTFCPTLRQVRPNVCHSTLTMSD